MNLNNPIIINQKKYSSKSLRFPKSQAKGCKVSHIFKINLNVPPSTCVWASTNLFLGDNFSLVSCILTSLTKDNDFGVKRSTVKVTGQVSLCLPSNSFPYDNSCLNGSVIFKLHINLLENHRLIYGHVDHGLTIGHKILLGSLYIHLGDNSDIFISPTCYITLQLNVEKPGYSIFPVFFYYLTRYLPSVCIGCF